MAAESIQGRVLGALLIALKPLARALIRAGIGYREFSDVAKAAFVQIATEDYGIRGRPTNVSRVSVITGIARKEVGRIRSWEGNSIADFIREPPAASILHLWHTEAEYLDSGGRPRTLSYDSEKQSFASLVSRCAGDIPPGAMRSELIRVGAVRELGNRRLEILKRHYVPARVDEKLLHGLESAIWSLAETISYNCDPNIDGSPRFQRVISADGISPDRFLGIQTETKSRLVRFTEEYDDYLSDLEAKYKDERTGTQVGIGVYYYEFSPNGADTGKQ